MQQVGFDSILFYSILSFPKFIASCTSESVWSPKIDSGVGLPHLSNNWRTSRRSTILRMCISELQRRFLEHSVDCRHPSLAHDISPVFSMLRLGVECRSLGLLDCLVCLLDAPSRTHSLAATRGILRRSLSRASQDRKIYEKKKLSTLCMNRNIGARHNCGANPARSKYGTTTARRYCS